MSLKNEKYKNKLENGRKKKFGKEFAEIPKGKRYVEELEPLLGAVIVLECDDWVFIPGELGGIPCEKLLLKSVKANSMMWIMRREQRLRLRNILK